MTVSTQPREALKRANSTRSAMADVKREVRRKGRLAAAHLLRQPTEPLARMKVAVFLCSIRQVGQSKAIELLKDAGLPVSSMTWRIGPLYETWAVSKNARTLTARQRAALAESLKGVKHWTRAELEAVDS